jgi:hypothetical protein
MPPRRRMRSSTSTKQSDEEVLKQAEEDFNKSVQELSRSEYFPYNQEEESLLEDAKNAFKSCLESAQAMLVLKQAEEDFNKTIQEISGSLYSQEDKSHLKDAENAFKSCLKRAHAMMKAATAQEEAKSTEMPQMNVSVARFSHPPKLHGSHKGTFEVWRYLVEDKLRYDGALYPSDQIKGAYVFSLLAGESQELAFDWIKKRWGHYTHTELLDFLERTVV